MSCVCAFADLKLRGSEVKVADVLNIGGPFYSENALTCRLNISSHSDSCDSAAPRRISRDPKRSLKAKYTWADHPKCKFVCLNIIAKTHYVTGPPIITKTWNFVLKRHLFRFRYSRLLNGSCLKRSLCWDSPKFVKSAVCFFVPACWEFERENLVVSLILPEDQINIMITAKRCFTTHSSRPEFLSFPRPNSPFRTFSENPAFPRFETKFEFEIRTVQDLKMTRLGSFERERKQNTSFVSIYLYIYIVCVIQRSSFLRN